MSHLKPGEKFIPPKNHKFLIQAIQTTGVTNNISDYVIFIIIKGDNF